MSKGPWWVKTSIFWFFEKFSKMKKIIIFSYQDNWNIKIHANGWKMWKSVNWAKNVQRSTVGKNFNYFDFSKSFLKWRKSSYSDIRTIQIQKFTSFGWKMWKCVNWAKNVHRSAVGENFKFLDFSKNFRKWRKSSYFDIKTTQIQKFTHLDEKCEKVWIEHEMSTGLQRVKTSNF